jgi:hypothetical protein
VLLNLDPTAAATAVARVQLHSSLPPTTTTPNTNSRHLSFLPHTPRTQRAPNRCLQILMGLHILLALPVIVVPFRRSIEGLEAAAVAMCKMRDSAARVRHETLGSMQVLGQSLLDRAEEQ